MLRWDHAALKAEWEKPRKGPWNCVEVKEVGNVCALCLANSVVVLVCWAFCPPLSACRINVHDRFFTRFALFPLAGGWIRAQADAVQGLFHAEHADRLQALVERVHHYHEQRLRHQGPRRRPVRDPLPLLRPQGACAVRRAALCWIVVWLLRGVLLSAGCPCLVARLASCRPAFDSLGPTVLSLSLCWLLLRSGYDHGEPQRGHCDESRLGQPRQRVSA